MDQAPSMETSSRRRCAILWQLNKIFDKWNRLSESFDIDELRLALSETPECFKFQQQLDKSYLDTIQVGRHDTIFDWVQDKHTVIRKKQFEIKKP